MNGKPGALLLSGLLAACVQTQSPEAITPSASPPPPAQTQAPAPTQAAAEPAPAERIVSIRGARCQGLLSLSPEDRAAASMFYIGYQASRLRASTINVGVIPRIEEQAIAYCEENPDRTVAQAFAQAYARTRRQ
jgi:HdeA/HdeB family